MLLAKTTFEGAVARRVAGLIAATCLLTLWALWRPSVAVPVAAGVAKLLAGVQEVVQSLQTALAVVGTFFWTAHPGLLALGVAVLSGTAHLRYWRHSRWDRDGTIGRLNPTRISVPGAVHALDIAGTVVAAGTLMLAVASTAYRARSADWTDIGIALVGLAPLVAVLLHKGRMLNHVHSPQADAEGFVGTCITIAFMAAGASLGLGTGLPAQDAVDAVFLGLLGGMLTGVLLCLAVRLPLLPLRVASQADAMA